MQIERAIMTSHYNEDLSWLNCTDLPKFIYSKTDSKYRLVGKNKGQEVPCFLSYIVDHYDSLPVKTLFMHGHRISGHMDFNADEIIPKLNWDLDMFFSINKREWYQEISEDVFLDEGALKVWLGHNWYIFKGYLPFPEKVKFYSGAQFVVHRDLITQYPKTFWSNLYDWVQGTYLSNFITSRIFEYTWHYIFTKNPIEKEYTYNNIFIQ